MINIESFISIKQWIIELLSNPITGSVIGLMGLVFSVWSLIETKIVKKYVEKEKTEAIYKYQFSESKETLKKQFEKQLKSVKELNMLNSSVCNELMALTQKLLLYESIFKRDDKKYLEESKNIFRDLSLKNNYVFADCTTIIERTTQITLIIGKGEYSK